MLVVAAAAFAEVGASRHHPLRRGLNYSLQQRSREAAPFLGDFSLDALAFEHEWDEHGFTAPMFVLGKARQTVTAVDQLFNGEEQ